VAPGAPSVPRFVALATAGREVIEGCGRGGALEEPTQNRVAGAGSERGTRGPASRGEVASAVMGGRGA